MALFSTTLFATLRTNMREQLYGPLLSSIKLATGLIITPLSTLISPHSLPSSPMHGRTEYLSITTDLIVRPVTDLVALYSPISTSKAPLQVPLRTGDLHVTIFDIYCRFPWAAIGATILVASLLVAAALFMIVQLEKLSIFKTERAPHTENNSFPIVVSYDFTNLSVSSMPSSFGSELFGFRGHRLELEAPVTAGDPPHDLPLCTATELDEPVNGVTNHVLPESQVISTSPTNLEGIHSVSEHVDKCTQTACDDDESDRFLYPGSMEDISNKLLRAINRNLPPGRRNADILTLLSESLCAISTGHTAAPIATNTDNFRKKLLRRIFIPIGDRLMLPSMTAGKTTAPIATEVVNTNFHPSHLHETTPVTSDISSSVMIGETTAPIIAEVVNTNIHRSRVIEEATLILGSACSLTAGDTTAPLVTENLNPVILPSQVLRETAPIDNDSLSSATAGCTTAPIITKAVGTHTHSNQVLGESGPLGGNYLSSAIGRDTTARNFGLGDIPGLTPIIPESTQIIPESTQIIPESTQIIPESTQIIPESTQIIPESTPIIPESTQTIPESTQIISLELPSEGLAASRWAPGNCVRNGVSESTPLKVRAGARKYRGSGGSYQRRRQAVRPKAQAGPSAPASAALAQPSGSPDPMHPHKRPRGPGGDRTPTSDPHTDAHVGPGASTSAFPPAAPPTFQKSSNSGGDCNWAEIAHLEGHTDQEVLASSSSKSCLPNSIHGFMPAVDREVGRFASRWVAHDHSPSEGEGRDGSRHYRGNGSGRGPRCGRRDKYGKYNGARGREDGNGGGQGEGWGTNGGGAIAVNNDFVHPSRQDVTSVVSASGHIDAPYVIYSTLDPKGRTGNGSSSAVTPSDVTHGSTNYDTNNVQDETTPPRAVVSPPSELHLEGPGDPMQSPGGDENGNSGYEGGHELNDRRDEEHQSEHDICEGGHEHGEGSSEWVVGGMVRRWSIDGGDLARSDRPLGRSPDRRNTA